MTRDYALLDVFTDRLFGGNQLAVFHDAGGLGAETMQAIARELNLSETVFVLPAEKGGDFRLRIFTPSMELPFAGHPTIGAAIALAERHGGSVILFEEAAGPVPVSLERRGDRLFATLTSPKLPERLAVDIAPDILAATLGLPTGALADGAASAYSAGVPFLFISVVSQDALNAVTLDIPSWREHVSGTAAPHVVALWIDERSERHDIHMRMFAPMMGIAEDPATGAAAAALAGLLIDRQQPPVGASRWVVHQGLAMGRPSTIHLSADVEADRLVSVRVGGTAVVVGRGTLDVG